MIRKAVAHRKPSREPKRHAVEIRPRGQQRSVSLVPTIDLDAAAERIEQLEEELENAGIALFLHERERMSSKGGRLSVEEFLQEIGMDEFAGELSQP